MPYWEGSPEHWNAITTIQELKREYFNPTGIHAIHSDHYVITNPVTGQDVPLADLRYAAEHLAELVESGEISEDRWAFLWYH
jgi:hypothetical protein